MKTKTAVLYVDLPPGWHERRSDEVYLYGASKPYDDKPAGHVRVKVTVELPEVPVRDLPHDDTAKGEASL